MIKILFLAANPVDTSPLRLDEESRAIDQALRQSDLRDKIEIEQHWAVRISDLQSLLLRHQPHIVHFSGHGSNDSGIILLDDNGNSHPVPAQALEQLFSILQDNIKCVVLNACYSYSQAFAISQSIDFVVGMSDTLGDEAAAKFSGAFYQALGYGRDLQTAFELGRLQVDMERVDGQNVLQLLTKIEISERFTFSLHPHKTHKHDSTLDRSISRVIIAVEPEINHEVSTIRMLRLNHPVSIPDIFVDLNVLERLSQDFSFSKWKEVVDNERQNFDRLGLAKVKQHRIPALQKVEQVRKLMIVGKPGSGKTTLLQMLAAYCINDKLPWKEARHVPFFLRLRNVGSSIISRDLYSVIFDKFIHWGVSDTLEQILREGRLFLFLDGLDEVPLNSRASVVQKIHEFCLNYPRNRYIITARTQSFVSRFHNFTEVEIADFDVDQAETFIKNWFSIVVGESESEKLSVNLLKELRQSDQLAELAVTPILLNLICSVFWDEGGNLPKGRGMLYGKGLRDLLERLDSDKGIDRSSQYRNLTTEQKESLLAFIAYELLSEHELFPNEAQITELISRFLRIKKADAKKVLKSIEEQNGLIVERSEGYYSFSHLTFQEYFAAKYIATISDLNEQVQHLYTLDNREVFLLTTEISGQKVDLLRQFKHHIDQPLIEDPALSNIFTWVNDKSSRTESVFKDVLVRCFYFAIACAPIHAFREGSTWDAGLANTMDTAWVIDRDICLALYHCLLLRIYFFPSEMPVRLAIQRAGHTFAASVSVPLTAQFAILDDKLAPYIENQKIADEIDTLCPDDAKKSLDLLRSLLAEVEDDESIAPELKPLDESNELFIASDVESDKQVEIKLKWWETHEEKWQKALSPLSQAYKKIWGYTEISFDLYRNLRIYSWQIGTLIDALPLLDQGAREEIESELFKEMITDKLQ